MDPKASTTAEMLEAGEGAANPVLYYMEVHGVASTSGGIIISLSASTIIPYLETLKQIVWRFTDLGAVDLFERLFLFTDNIITQSASIHMLAKCTGLHWFESWGSTKLSEIGLPAMSTKEIITVYENEPVLQAFKLMRKKRIGGIPVIERGGGNAIAKNFLIVVRNYLEKHEKISPMLSGMITCKRDETVKDLIQKHDSEKIQRVYLVDDDGNLEGVITLRDIISRLVHEPCGYFGYFFDSVLPLPENSRV
ncbi:SNF1-related protein kinase regulatory subunit gamma-1 [Hibiscus syriacus]|uniref:SNF1-related protein kinase regulatory subunit gamma-1 n=1 Tax=Hibiscus syriacus TaxID=106335 RepID=A0A6A3BCE8_HIBSY|nr:SNF1-related protein kinase regulatory subunit gamma-1 [Hibiscus syriacus]